MEFELSLGRPRDTSTRPGDSLRLLLVGQFRGATSSSATPRPLAVDVDNFDERIALLAPYVELTDADGRPHSLTFKCLDDFHPDALLPALAGFSVASAPEPAATAEAPAPEAPAESDDDTFARLLGKPAEPERPTKASGFVDQLIRSAVADDIASPPAPDPSPDADEARLRAALHNPAFQKLEANWRSLFALVSELETGEALQVFMLDLSDADLHTALDVDDYQDSALYETLVDDDHGRIGGKAWHVIATMAGFTAADARRLGNFGAIAAAAGGVALADDEGLAGSTDDSAGVSFSGLRRLPVARHIALISPRVLLRLPYGRRSDPVDAIDFEECPGEPAEGSLLFGSGAALLALQFGQQFEAVGWRMAPGAAFTIADRPAFAFDRDGERKLAAVAAGIFSDSEAQAMLERGLTLLVAERDGNRLAVPRVLSIADPLAALKGPWA